MAAAPHGCGGRAGGRTALLRAPRTQRRPPPSLRRAAERISLQRQPRLSRHPAFPPGDRWQAAARAPPRSRNARLCDGNGKRGTVRAAARLLSADTHCRLQAHLATWPSAARAAGLTGAATHRVPLGPPEPPDPQAAHHLQGHPRARPP